MRNLLCTVVTVVTMLSVFCGANSAFAQGRCTQAIARVLEAEGIISVSSASGPQLIPVAAGTQIDICAGDSFQAGNRSRAQVILLATNQTIRVNQNTTITILADAPGTPRTIINLLRGLIRLFNPVGRQLDVRTPYVTAGTEGTEFFVSYEPETEDTTAGVMEGVVRVSTSAETVRLAPGEAVRARQGGPLQRLDIRPNDAVRWAIYYPVAMWTMSVQEEMTLDVGVRTAWQEWRNGNLPAFANALSAIPRQPPSDPSIPPLNAPSLLRFAALLLAVGQVEEASEAIVRADELLSRRAQLPLLRRVAAVAGEAPYGPSQVLKCADLRSGSPLALALCSIIAVARNQTDEALEASSRAVDAARGGNDQAGLIAAAIARSYALQSAFRLAEARAALASVSSADDPLVLARLAELDLSLGDNRSARREAQRASEIAPSLSLTSSILGFSALATYDFSAARAAFTKAAASDPGDPLPHLGLGLTSIRTGQIEIGRREMVVAVALDPENSIARSYLGKTYANVRLYEDAFRQWMLAETADPKDPTASLYRAFAERSLNRPVDALQDIEKSILLNDNRAVYRSRLLLDQDLATRTTDLAALYRDLGFDQLALSEGYKSVNQDPADPAAHRFLSDSYLTMPRTQLASDSELLQSLLLQPLNVQPLRPRLAQEGLGIIDLQGPFRIGFNEFNPLFASDGLSLLGDAFGGNRGTYGDNLVASGIYNNLSASAGQFYYRTEGIQPQNRLWRGVQDVLVQGALSDRASLIAEFRRSAYRSGQNGYYFAPYYVDNTSWQKADVSQYRVGGRFDLTPAITLVGVWTRQDRSADEYVPTEDFLTHDNEEGNLGEAAVYFSTPQFNVVAGGGYSDGHTKSDASFSGFSFPLEDVAHTHRTAWTYVNVEPLTNVHVTLGASFDAYRSKSLNRYRINPKVGVSWEVARGIALRAAYIEGLTRRFVGGQTIEPTEVVGFNQLFDDPTLSRRKRWGAGIDLRLTDRLFAGVEWSERRLLIHTGGPTAIPDDRASEETVRSYVNWTIDDRFVFGSGLQWDRLVGDPTGVAQFDDLNAIRVPAEIRYYDPTGFFALLGGAFVSEHGHFGLGAKGHDNFAVVNTGIGWRIPGRGAVASLQVTNLLNSAFRFQDVDLKNPAFLPHRMMLGRVTFTF